MQALNYQQIAIETFSNMLERANKFRNDETLDRELFNSHHGICYHVSLCVPNEHRYNETVKDLMTMVKDNTIRATPSYSGNYDYPVRAGKPSVKPEDAQEDAENEFDRSNCMWSGVYGANRVKQVEEILYIIKNKWSDKFLERMTPCSCLGIIKHETLLKHKETGKVYVLDFDDDTSSPYFKEHGTPLNQNGNECIDLNDLIIISVNIAKKTVRGYVQAMNRNDQQTAKVKAQIEKLQEKMLKLNAEMTSLSSGLLLNHGVKRA